MNLTLDPVEQWIEQQDWSPAVKARAVRMHAHRPGSPLTPEEWEIWAQMAQRVR